MSARIRPLRIEDLKDVAELCFPELPFDETEERVRDDLADAERGEGLTLVAEENGRVGVFARLSKSGEVGWIFNVSAHPDFRGRGIVQQLLSVIADEARRMNLLRLAIHVRADNPRARRAYEKAGFKHVGQDGMRGAQLRYEMKL